MFKRKNHRRASSNRRQSIWRQAWHFLQGAFIAAAILVCTFIAVWSWQRLHDPAVLPFRQVTFIGQLQHVAPSTLEGIVQQHLSGGFFVLDIGELRQAIKTLPWIDQVEIQRIWPDALRIQLSEQQPVARWGAVGLINPRAEIFKPAIATIPAGLPILYGPIALRRQVIDYYKKIQFQLSGIDLSVAKLWVNERRSWELQLTNGISVLLGQDEVLSRCQRLVRLYPRIVRAQDQDVERIDLRYPNGLAIKWRPQVGKFCQNLPCAGHSQ